MSNTLARLWALGISVVLLPIYIDMIGMEAYGLVGFYTMLLGSLAILDLGLSSTLNREMARSLAVGTPAQSIKNLVYSLELIYWVVGILIGLGVVLFAPLIANNWVKAGELSVRQITNSVMLMGGIIAFQWPQSIYTGGLMGLQKQVPFNIANVILSTLKSVGVIIVLKFYSSSIETFFAWQIIISFLSACVLRYLLWKFAPKSSENAVFSSEELKKIWRFAAGMTGIGLATFCLSQIDKVLLSKLLPLKEYGYYTLAWTVGTGIMLIVGVLGSVLLPKLTEIVARGNQQEITTNYHRFSCLVASLVMPIGILLCLFSQEIIWMWTQNIQTTRTIWLAVSILTVGSICNAIMNVPYYLLLAYGKTKFTFYQNIIASIIVVPLLFLWTAKWGLTGATLVWFSVNLGYNIISLPLMHRFLLKGELYKVYVNDIGVALLCSLVVIGLARIMLDTNRSQLFQGFYFVITLILTYVSIVFFSKEYKAYSAQLFQKIIPKLTNDK